MVEWFEQWFGEEYLELYPHRDQEEAGRAIELILSRSDLAPGSLVLDLACGAGRHSAVLASLGRRTVGLDLSMPLLSRARHRASGAMGFIRGDMRLLPFEDETFDAAINLFTSFGYFSHDSQHETVIHEVARVLKPGATFVLDYLNTPWVIDTLVSTERQELGTHVALIERRITEDSRFVEKTIRLEDDGRSFTERVRLFTGGELIRMFVTAGFDVMQTFGDYDGTAASDAQPRLILFAQRRS